MFSKGVEEDRLELIYLIATLVLQGLIYGSESKTTFVYLCLGTRKQIAYFGIGLGDEVISRNYLI